MNILIADDHDIFRQSLALLIEGRSAHKVVSHANSFAGLVELALRIEPDCMLLDYQMPGGDPMSVTEQLRFLLPKLKIILLTGIQSGMALQQLEATLCDGLLHKRDNAETILDGLEKVAMNQHYVSNSVAKLIADVQICLTQREIEVLNLFSQGLSLANIATQLAISSRTVEKHKENIMKKFNVASSTQLMDVAQKLWFGGGA